MNYFPIQIRPNVPRYDPLDKKVAVYGASFGKDLPDGRVVVAVTWIAPEFDEIGIRQLVDAARAYDGKRYDLLIVLANVAVESALGTAMYEWLRAFCGKDRAERFLADAATYFYQLHVLLPIACHSIGFKPLDVRHDEEYLIGYADCATTLRTAVSILPAFQRHRGGIFDRCSFRISLRSIIPCGSQTCSLERQTPGFKLMRSLRVAMCPKCVHRLNLCELFSG